jgi:RNA polymerase sigma-70 factor (ECF subfamily)
MIQDVTKYSTTSLADASDDEVLRISLSEPEAFRVLVERYEAAFLRRAKSILRSKEDAEEVVQDAFTRIYVYGNRYQPQEGASFSSWGYSILTRLAFTRYHKLVKHRKGTAPLETETYERIPDKADFLEDLSIRSEVLVALSKIPETAARVLRLQFIEGKTQEEIATLEGSTVSAVKTRVHRAKKLFKQSYDEQRID